MPDPLHRKLFGQWSTGPWIHATETRPRKYAEELATGGRFKRTENQRGLSEIIAQQKRIGQKELRKGAWEPFKKLLKNHYHMNDDWIENKSGSARYIVNGLTHIKKFVDEVYDLAEDDIHVSNLMKDINNALIKSLSKISDRNEMRVNEGIFRNYINMVCPEFNQMDMDNVNIPMDQYVEDEINQVRDKLAAWMV